MSASSARDINSLPENLLLADTSVWAPAHRCTIIINQYSEPPLLRTGPNWINYVQFFFPNLTLLKEVIHKMGSGDVVHDVSEQMSSLRVKKSSGHSGVHYLSPPCSVS